MRKENNFWGIILILCAVYLLTSKMGFMKWLNIGVWSTLFTIFFLYTLLKGISRMNFYSIFISLAFLGIVHDDFLGIEAITPWPILGAAILLGMGFNMIFPNRRKHKNHIYITSHDTPIINNTNGERVLYNVSFSSAVNYVNSTSFREASFDCSFGSLKVYFDHAIMAEDTAVIYIDNSFGSTELFIPKEWKVIKQLECSFGGVDEKGIPMEDGIHTVYLRGDTSFGGVTIHYV